MCTYAHLGTHIYKTCPWISVPEHQPWWVVLFFRRCTSAQLQQGRAPQKMCCCRLLSLALHSCVSDMGKRGAHASESPIPILLDASADRSTAWQGSSVGWGFCSPGHGQSHHHPISHHTMPNFLCCYIISVSCFLLTTDFVCHIPLCKMSEGWTDNTAAHVFALPLYRCKWWCKVKGKGKLCTLGQVVSLYMQHWLITDINSLINLVRL